MANPPSCVRLSGNICGLLLGVICVFGGNVGKGNQHVKRRCRCRDNVLLQDGKHALAVNGVEMTVVNAKTGEQLYYNTFITNHRLRAENVAQVAQADRGRWKIENENNNVLKTKGYHLEHNFGHGK